MDASVTSLVPLMAISVALGLITFAIIASTAFVKLAVVLFLVRNALGIQQTPPNMVLYTIAITLTIYIGVPMATDVFELLDQPGMRYDSISAIMEAASIASEPVRDFMGRFAREDERAFFAGATAELWDEDLEEFARGDSFAVLAPSFLISELRRAFEIGFLIYLPFVVIDLVVTTILMAMGMMMVSPTIISTPFKLLLFVAVDGWSRLVHGLVMSYV